MSVTPAPDERINLSTAEVLVLESSRIGMSIVTQILSGFGCRKVVRAYDVEQAQEAIGQRRFDLLIVDTMGGGGFDFVGRLRASGEINWTTPVLMLSGHTPASAVNKARDCGADLMVAKPLAAIQLLDRMLWIARRRRTLVECDGFIGPDRRFHVRELPAGQAPRRRQDLQQPLEAQA